MTSNDVLDRTAEKHLEALAGIKSGIAASLDFWEKQAKSVAPSLSPAVDATNAGDLAAAWFDLAEAGTKAQYAVVRVVTTSLSALAGRAAPAAKKS